MPQMQQVGRPEKHGAGWLVPSGHAGFTTLWSASKAAGGARAPAFAGAMRGNASTSRLYDGR